MVVKAEVSEQPLPDAPLAEVMPLLRVPDAEMLDLNGSFKALTFVSPPTYLVCSICKSVAFEPINLECPHVHCRGCLEDRLEEDRCCPTCSQDISTDWQLQLNGSLQQQIVELRIACKHHGCPWEEPLGMDFNHALSHDFLCEYRTAKCPACKEQVRTSEAMQHPDQCSARFIFCRHCSMYMKCSEFEAHLTAQSVDGPPEAPCSGSILCPNKCYRSDDKLSFRSAAATEEQGDGIMVLAKEQLALHLPVCHRRPVKCSCCQPSEEVDHRDLADHMHDKLVGDEEAQANMCTLLLRQSDEMQQLRDELSAVNQKLIDQSNSSQFAGCGHQQSLATTGSKHGRGEAADIGASKKQRIAIADTDDDEASEPNAAHPTAANED